MTELDRVLATLSAEQRRDLLRRLEDGAPPALRRRAASEAPLSFAQQRLWFLSQLQPQLAAYHICHAIRWPGRLDRAALAAALHDLTARHESLRTRFVGGDGEPRQVVEPEVTVPLAVVDARGIPAAERDRLARSEARRPFDLGRAPLLRVLVLDLGDTDHVVVLCQHHIVSDGWSTNVLLDELLRCYRAREAGRAPDLPELPVQYADFAVWQREELDGGVLDQQLGYWRERLAGLPAALDLPTDHPRPAVQGQHGATERFTLPGSLRDALAELGRRQGATLFMTLLAGFLAVLHRHSGQEDLAVGVPVDNRARTELEGLVGFFVNTLVLRADVSGDPAFEELVARVRDGTLAAHEHQDVPFERLVEITRPDRDLSRAPLAQVMFALQHAPVGADAAELRGRVTLVDTGATRCDLTVALEEGPDGIEGLAEYDRSLFEPVTIARLCGHLGRLLEDAVADPSRSLSELALLTGEEERQLEAWSGSATQYPRDRCVHELFAEQAARRPDAPAVRAGERVLSYGDLEARADRLARALHDLGVGPDVPAGVCLERSPELVVALLAVLKAGGAYVPLDPTYPPERLAFLLADAGATALVTSRALHNLIDGWDGPALLVDDELAADLPAGPTVTDPRNLAYVMYTSGSTGPPKGIGVPHRGVVRLVRDTNYLRIRSGDRVAFASSVSFDATTLELWGPLLNGAEVVVIPRDVALDPAAFAAELRRRQVTVTWLTSSLFNELVREVPDAVAPVATVLVGGEALDPETIRRVLRQGRPARLLNGYGPTECTTFTTTYEIGALADDARGVPIGGPVANTRVHVLDDRMRPVPVGVPGELYVGGDGLARGYVRRPALTAERFLPAPLGERLYRTGDRVRFRTDGDLEFLGRLDDQIKLRGYRIEPGEIETRMRAHPGIAAAAVLLSVDGADRRLVAYVVAEGADRPSAHDLRAWLGRSLPDYMLPSAFAVLDELPLTRSGKVDRARLPAPGPAVADAFVAPRDGVEADVAAAWAQVLGLERVGVRDNFFALGGHSLLATQAVARLRRAFAVDLPLRTLFENPTVETLAAAVVETMMAGRDPVELDRMLTAHEATEPDG